jgi:hypothetical protein
MGEFKFKIESVENHVDVIQFLTRFPNYPGHAYLVQSNLMLITLAMNLFIAISLLIKCPAEKASVRK